ncbi:MAG: C4-type zinc ribbon domain-containing protein [Propionibacteriaceae bacterium]|nr:C4-type zinc ribbon domain-containing protein [Propionibacteriaceae bacterium]
MKAAPEAQAALLKLVDFDAKIKALEARKRTLPEHEQLNQLNAQRRSLADVATAATTRANDTTTAMTRTEDDLGTARTRLARDRQRIDDGVVNDARSISSLQDEIAHLEGRVAELEDTQLEQMMSIEEDQKITADANATRADVETQMRTLIASRNAATKEADDEIAQLGEQRQTVVSGLPADLVALYDRQATRSGPGAAGIKGGRCTGCGLVIDALALRSAEDAAPDEVVRCPECGCILVRA